jgi:hypothetical protein
MIQIRNLLNVKQTAGATRTRWVLGVSSVQ